MLLRVLEEVYSQLKTENLSLAAMFRVIDIKICSLDTSAISIEECEVLCETFSQLNELLLPHLAFTSADVITTTGPFDAKYLAKITNNNQVNLEVLNKVKAGRIKVYYQRYPELKELMQKLIPSDHE